MRAGEGSHPPPLAWLTGCSTAVGSRKHVLVLEPLGLNFLLAYRIMVARSVKVYDIPAASVVSQ